MKTDEKESREVVEEEMLGNIQGVPTICRSIYICWYKKSKINFMYTHEIQNTPNSTYIYIMNAIDIVFPTTSSPITWRHQSSKM